MLDQRLMVGCQAGQGLECQNLLGFILGAEVERCLDYHRISYNSNTNDLYSIRSCDILTVSRMRPTSSYSNLILLTMIPFIVGDLYFAYKDFSCTHDLIANTKITFDLSTWLKVSGYTNMAFVLFPILGFFLANCAPALLMIYLIFVALYVFFRFAWLVVGAVMFWGFLWPNRLCSNALHTYLWINLIYSFFTLFILCYLQQQVFELRNSQTTYLRTNERTRLNL